MENSFDFEKKTKFYLILREFWLNSRNAEYYKKKWRILNPRPFNRLFYASVSFFFGPVLHSLRRIWRSSLECNEWFSFSLSFFFLSFSSVLSIPSRTFWQSRECTKSFSSSFANISVPFFYPSSTLRLFLQISVLFDLWFRFHRPPNALSFETILR